MMFFQQRRPRPFHHEYIYVDERKERLRQIEERAARAVQEKVGNTPDADRWKGRFTEATPRLRRHRHVENRFALPVSIALPVLLLFLLALIWVYINM